MGSSPKPPDPVKQANAQAGANRDAAISGAIINNIDESSPFGSVDYSRTGYETYTDSQGNEVKVPTYRRDVTLSPEQQALYNRQVKAGKNLGNLAVSQSSRLNSVLSEPFNPTNLPDRPDSVSLNTNGPSGPTYQRVQPGGESRFRTSYRTDRVQPGASIQGEAGASGPNGGNTTPDVGNAPSGQIRNTIGPSNFSEDRRRVEDAHLSRFNRLHERDWEAFETKLLNQGITPGSKAWEARMDELRRQQTDAYNQAILAGGQEQSRLTGLEISKGNFENAAQNQLFSQNLAAVEQNNRTARNLATFRNQAEQNRINAEIQQRGFNNQVSEREFNNRLSNFEAENRARLQQQDAQQSLRNAALEENFALRNQPINEITALLSGGQVTAPQFTDPYRQAVQAAPIGDYISANYQQRSANSANQLSGLFGLANGALTASSLFI